MVNPLELLQAQVDKANYLLKKKKVGATVYIRKDGFFLRAYLPSKTNPDWNKLTQQWIPIGLKAHNKNLKKASDLAKELGAEKASRLFTWDKWLEKDEYQPPTKKKRSYLMKDLLKEFDIWYWNQPNKNRENTSNKKGYQHILNYLNKLGGNKLLNLKNVRELAETYPHGSKSQMEIAKQFFRLAKFADIQDLKKFGEWAVPTQQNYKPKKREKLSDNDYFEFAKAVREDPKWGWAVAAMLVFGCRTSEIWSVQPYEKQGKILAKIITVDKATKPDEWRISLALEQEWARELNILEVSKDWEINTLEDYDGAKVKSVGDRFRKWFKKKCAEHNVEFQPYDLRHSFGHRTANKNISTVNASKWMGHSPEIHSKTYQSGYDEGDILAVAENLNL